MLKLLSDLLGDQDPLKRDLLPSITVNFPKHDVSEIFAILMRYEGHCDRLHTLLAIVKLSEGDIDQLTYFVHAASRDCESVLRLANMHH